jgi:hypothetical protein
MSDFLSNLISRSFADAPAIQPRLTSLFEVGVAGPLAESQLVLEPTAETKMSGSMDAVAPPLAQTVSIPRDQNPDRVPQPVNQLPPAKNSETTIAPAPISEPSRSQAIFETGAIEPVATQTPLAKSEKKFSSPATRPVSPAPEAKHFSETNRSTRRRSPLAQFEPPTTGGPTINVTIGRVEVRAIQSPAPAPKPARPAPPKLSLDDYLQKRGGVR